MGSFLVQVGLVAWWLLDLLVLVFVWDYLQILELSLYSTGAVHFYFQKKKQRWRFEANRLIPFWKEHLLGRVSLFSFRKSTSRIWRGFARFLVAILGKKYLTKAERRALELKTRHKEDEARAQTQHGEDFKEKVRKEYRLRRRAGLKDFFQSIFVYFLRKHFEEYRYLREEYLPYFVLWAKKEDQEVMRREQEEEEAEAEAEAEAETETEEAQKKEGKKRQKEGQEETLFWNGLRRIHFLIHRVDKPKGKGPTDVRCQESRLLANQQQQNRDRQGRQKCRFYQSEGQKANCSSANLGPEDRLLFFSARLTDRNSSFRSVLPGVFQQSRLHSKCTRFDTRALHSRPRHLESQERLVGRRNSLGHPKSTGDAGTPHEHELPSQQGQFRDLGLEFLAAAVARWVDGNRQKPLDSTWKILCTRCWCSCGFGCAHWKRSRI